MKLLKTLFITALSGSLFTISIQTSVMAQEKESFGPIKSLHELSYKEARVAKRVVMNTRRFYDHSSGFKRNNLKIQLVQLPTTGKITYERSLSRKFAVGTNVSIQYLGAEAGTYKVDVFGKYFLTYRSPIGLYVYSTLGIAQIRNHEVAYRMTATEGGAEIKYDPKRPYTIDRKVSYSSVIGSLGLGFQNVFGPRKQFISDFGIGYQISSLPQSIKTGITQNQFVYGKFDPKNGLLGPTSPLQVRAGIGFLF